jgi:hypothetical protein
MLATVNASPLLARFGTPVDRESAREILAVAMNAAAAADAAAETGTAAAAVAAKAAKAAKVGAAEYAKAQTEWERASKPRTTTTRTTTSRSRAQTNPIEEMLGSRTGQTVVREVLRGIFGTLKRR